MTRVVALMNKRQKEVQQSVLKNEKQVLNQLQENYIVVLDDIQEKIKILQSDALTQSKIYQLEYQKALEKQVSGILEVLKGNNFTTVNKYLQQCYEAGFLGTLYDLHGQGVPLLFPINQAEVVEMIQKTHDDIKLSDRLYDNVDSLKDDVISEVSRGISNGYSYQKIAQNLSLYGEASINRAMTIARTEGHRVQNQSQMKTMRRAKDAGAGVVKQWDSTLDGRTRSDHQKLDGQIKEIDEYFEINGHKALHPGSFGIAKEDINCRCVMLQRARWMLDEDELNTLKERAEFYGLDKTKDFDDFRARYLKAEPPVKLDLQHFAKGNDKEELLSKIERGIIDEDLFRESHGYFREQMKGGVKTPIEKVYDKGDKYYHIVNHHGDMLGKSSIDRIIQTLQKPEAIYETMDKFGIKGKCYVENNTEEPLIVITRNGIITAYKPNQAYLGKIKGGKVLWLKN
ncbi:MAG: phage minor head protein [Muricomes sp.]